MSVVKLSKLVTDAVAEAGDDDDDDDMDTSGPRKHVVPLVNTSSEVLEKVIEFCTHYEQVEPMKDIETPFPKEADEDGFELKQLVQEWYADFCQLEDKQVLFQLLISANFMNIKPLLDLTCLAVAKYIHKKSIEEIRDIFKIEKPKQSNDNDASEKKSEKEEKV